MKTYILKPYQIDSYYNFVIATSETIEESMLKIGMFGLQEYTLEEAKKIAEIGDCILVKYENKMVPFQILEKEMVNGKLQCIIQSYYLLEKQQFDTKSNVWKNASIRKYLNGKEFAKKFDQEFIDSLIGTEVHTDDYVTIDKFWLPSHEEIGYVDKNKMFKSNVGVHTYEFYKDGLEEC